MKRVFDVIDLFQQEWLSSGVEPAYPVDLTMEPQTSYAVGPDDGLVYEHKEDAVRVRLIPVEHSAATPQKAVDELSESLRFYAHRLLDAALTPDREAVSGDAQEVAGMLRTTLKKLVAYRLDDRTVFVAEGRSPLVMPVAAEPTIYFLPEKDAERPYVATAKVGMACLGDGVAWVRGGEAVAA